MGTPNDSYLSPDNPTQVNDLEETDPCYGLMRMLLTLMGTDTGGQDLVEDVEGSFVWCLPHRP